MASRRAAETSPLAYEPGFYRLQAAAIELNFKSRVYAEASPLSWYGVIAIKCYHHGAPISEQRDTVIGQPKAFGLE